MLILTCPFSLYIVGEQQNSENPLYDVDPYMPVFTIYCGRTGAAH